MTIPLTRCDSVLRKTGRDPAFKAHPDRLQGGITVTVDGFAPEERVMLGNGVTRFVDMGAPCGDDVALDEESEHDFAKKQRMHRSRRLRNAKELRTDVREGCADGFGDRLHFIVHDGRNPTHGKDVIHRPVDLRHDRARLDETTGDEPGIVESLQLARRFRKLLMRDEARKHIVQASSDRIRRTRSAKLLAHEAAALTSFAPEERFVHNRLPPSIDRDERPTLVILGNRAFDDGTHLLCNELPCFAHDTPRKRTKVAVDVARRMLGKKVANLLTVNLEGAEGLLSQIFEPADIRFSIRMQVSDEASFVESPDQIVPGWHLGLNCLFELDAAAFHFGNQVDATQRKEQEGIGINFFAQLVDGGCNVLARHRPIRTRARHLQILPARRENANAERLGNVGNFGTQFSRGEARHDERRFGKTVNKTCHVRLVDRRKRDLDAVEGIVVSRDARLDLALFFASSQEAVNALLEKGLANKGETIEVQEGLVNDAVTGKVAVDEAGNSTLTDGTVQKNSTVDAFGSVASLTAYQWRHEMNDLTKRMGELRMSPEGVGSWARIYGSTFEYGAQNLTAKNNSVQVGVDATAGAGWTVGAAFSYTDGSTTYDRGEADNEAYALGVYGTWMHESGQFVDLIAKYGRLSNDFTLAGLEGSFESNAFSVSAEYGWHLKLSDVAFVEPQAEVSYGRIMGDDFTASRGDQSVRFSQEDTEFLITRLGVRTGFYFPKDRGTVYADLGGTWLEWGLGASFNLTDRSFAYVDLERTTGAEADEKVRYSVGVRHIW